MIWDKKYDDDLQEVTIEKKNLLIKGTPGGISQHWNKAKAQRIKCWKMTQI